MRNKAKAPSIAQESLKGPFFSEYRGRYRFSQPMSGDWKAAWKLRKYQQIMEK